MNKPGHASKQRLIVGITGASGAVYGVRLLEKLREFCADAIQTHLVITPSAEKTLSLETDYAINYVRELADFVHGYADIAAPISSGSFITMGMVVVPCSMRTLSDIAHSRADNLLVRSADVTLKEGRKLVIVPRETPLHKGHIRLMLTAAENGSVILPPMPAFYHKPKTVDDIVDQTVGKILDQFGVEHDIYKRWGGGKR
ncbi:MAG: UbiX family flavin prenyltransferase [Nitrospinae bacterium]|nr:UbiX family flavin prenyltransferase [Nitrospinota bacterium]